MRKVGFGKVLVYYTGKELLPPGGQRTEGKGKTMMNFKNKRGKGGKAKDGDSVTPSGVADKGNGGSIVSIHQHEVKRKILMVSTNYAFTNGVVDYAANLSQRLGYDIIGMNVNPTLAQTGKFFSPYNQHLRGKFIERAQAAWSPVEAELASQGISGEHVVKFEGLAGAIKDLNHEVKRIDFVITDSGIKDEEITGEIPLPVFSISGYQGERIMAQEHHEAPTRSKLIGKTVAMGVGSLALYAAVFINSDTVMKYFTKGGIFASLPIITVFAVSFIYGAFASNLWSVLGIEATKKVQPRVAPKRPAPRKRPRPQLNLNA
jgi:hypothetical protein